MARDAGRNAIRNGGPWKLVKMLSGIEGQVHRQEYYQEWWARDATRNAIRNGEPGPLIGMPSELVGQGSW